MSLNFNDDIIASILEQLRTYPQENDLPYEPPPGPVMDGISGTVSSPTCGKTALRRAIDELGNSASSVELCFTNVASRLAASLAVAFTRDQQQGLLQFQGEWNPYRKMYIDLLSSSRTIASHARTTAKDFAINLRMDESISIQEKKEEIQGYLEQLVEDIKRFDNVAQGFLDLQTNVTDFDERVTVWLRKRKQQLQQIDQLPGAIKATRQAIENSGFVMISCFISSDIREIEKSMEMVVMAKSRALFWKRLKVVEQIYSQLGDALYQYEARVHTSPGFTVQK